MFMVSCELAGDFADLGSKLMCLEANLEHWTDSFVFPVPHPPAAYPRDVVVVKAGGRGRESTSEHRKCIMSLKG